MKRTIAILSAAALLVLGLLTRLPRGESSTIDVNTPVPEVGAPGGPSRQLDDVELAQWIRGRLLFDKPFHFDEGLGSPEYNCDSCRACHQDPALGGAGPLELNVSRFGFDAGGGLPFQDLPGGQAASKFRRPDAVTLLGMTPREEIDPSADVFEQRQSISILGDGALDLVPDLEILANEDPTDANADGIFGVARRIMVNGVEEIGRFGWKAQIPRLADFVRDAGSGELGLTFPDNGRGFGLTSDDDPIPDPELSEADVSDMAFFLGHLAAPQRKGSTDPAVAQGEALFAQIGCNLCHVPTLLGAEGPVPAYTNLLLHNVQHVSFRGMAEPGAGVGMFRTPPLWGVSGTAPYMHDGRAATLRDAIIAHDGEALTVRQAFEALLAEEQQALIAFLEDL